MPNDVLWSVVVWCLVGDRGATVEVESRLECVGCRRLNAAVCGLMDCVSDVGSDVVDDGSVVNSFGVVERPVYVISLDVAVAVAVAYVVVVAAFALKPDKLVDITKVDEPLSDRELVAVCEVVTVGACVAVGVAVFVLKPDKLDDITKVDEPLSDR